MTDENKGRRIEQRRELVQELTRANDALKRFDTEERSRRRHERCMQPLRWTIYESGMEHSSRQCDECGHKEVAYNYY